MTLGREDLLRIAQEIKRVPIGRSINVEEIADRLGLGTEEVQAAAQQFGVKTGPKGVPRRGNSRALNDLLVQESDKAEVKSISKAYGQAQRDLERPLASRAAEQAKAARAAGPITEEEYAPVRRAANRAQHFKEVRAQSLLGTADEGVDLAGAASLESKVVGGAVKAGETGLRAGRGLRAVPAGARLLGKVGVGARTAAKVAGVAGRVLPAAGLALLAWDAVNLIMDEANKPAQMRAARAGALADLTQAQKRSDEVGGLKDDARALEFGVGVARGDEFFEGLAEGQRQREVADILGDRAGELMSVARQQEGPSMAEIYARLGAL